MMGSKTWTLNGCGQLRPILLFEGGASERALSKGPETGENSAQLMYSQMHGEITVPQTEQTGQKAACGLVD